MNRAGEQSDEFEGYDRLAGMVGNPPSEHSALTVLAAEVVADYRGRARAIEYSGQRSPSTKRERGWRDLHRTQDEVILSVIGFVALSIISQSLWVALPALAAVVIVLSIRAARRRNAMNAATHPGSGGVRCRNCTYDLTGLPDSIPHEWIAAHAGPRRCPECGEPWPLVPRTV